MQAEDFYLVSRDAYSISKCTRGHQINPLLVSKNQIKFLLIQIIIQGQLNNSRVSSFWDRKLMLNLRFVSRIKLILQQPKPWRLQSIIDEAVSRQPRQFRVLMTP
jgi:hypothetical protein